MAAVALALAYAVGQWELTVETAQAWVAGTAVLGGVLLAVTLGIDLVRSQEPAAPVEDPPRPPIPALRPEDGRRIRAIAASGGGIRAASFVLGGHQAVQAKARPLGMSDPAAEPELFAVSGGSYMAAALAMRRAFDPETGRHAPYPSRGRPPTRRDHPSWIGSGGTPATCSSRGPGPATASSAWCRAR